MLEVMALKAKVLWIRSEAHMPGVGPVANFRKTTTTLMGPVNQSGMKVFFNIQNFAFRITKTEGPAPGTPITVVFELMLDGSPHPRPWARLPKVGCFEDWNLANSIGVRVEWSEKNGGPQAMTLQASKREWLLDDNDYGANGAYGWAIAFVRFFN